MEADIGIGHSPRELDPTVCTEEPLRSTHMFLTASYTQRLEMELMEYGTEENKVELQAMNTPHSRPFGFNTASPD